MKDPRRRLDAATVRALSAAAGVDPRSIVRTYAGHPVRGMAGKRARLALVKAGLLPETADDTVNRVAINEASAES